MANKIFGSLEQPKNNEKILGKFLTISGWALSKKSGYADIEIRLDEKFLCNVLCNRERLDVINKFPELKEYTKCGFYKIVNAENLTEGIHTIEIFATSEKNSQSIGKVSFEINSDLIKSIQNDMKKKHLNRWKSCKPDVGLTWGKQLTGDAFLEIAQKYLNFSPEKSILELGPGYGRILSSIISKKIPFKNYVGLDISENNISTLQEKFNQPNISFLQAEFSSIQLKNKFDYILSSLTLKHQYPTFLNAIKNLSKFLNIGGRFFFDLQVNHNILNEINIDQLVEFGPQMSSFEEDGVFIGHYSEKEASLLIEKVSLKLIATDYVTHSPDMGSRLVVVAEKNSFNLKSKNL